MTPDHIQELEIKFLQLKDKTKKYFLAKDEYFKSGKDQRKLIILKSIEKEIRELINPKEKQQKSLFDWLAQ